MNENNTETANRLFDHIKKLESYCSKQNYRGYSLYDSHNSVIPFEKFGHWISFLTNQVVKRSPINLRRLLGVKKGINPKGMGLLLHSYSLLIESETVDIPQIENKAKEIFQWLYDHRSEGYSGACWGYNYDWPRSDRSIFHAFTPSVVVTAFIARGLMAYYRVSRDERVKELIKSATSFVKNDVHCTTFEGHSRCYSYTPVQRDLVINANLLAAEILAYDDELSDTQEHLPIVKEVLQYTLNTQNEDGSWYYSHSPDTGKPKKQIDFHQGYVIDSIDILTKIYNLSDGNYQEAIKNGLSYYREKQFHTDGYAYWRIPKVYPVDIHNQSQGIISLARFRAIEKQNLGQSLNVYKWTIQNMRATSGRFYYQKYAWFTNRTDYFRWNQCWMLLAMVKLYLALKQ
ncbi:MAG: hypothetical protein R8G66_13015 [Cytophagales bacterium]|nr:hypothetical protein [Cytophagales bacterium]